MYLRLIFAITISVITASHSLGFEVGGLIRKVDAEKRIASVFAGGRERTVKVSADAEILDENGKPLQGGLSAKELSKGTIVTLTVQRIDNAPTIVVIQIGGQVRPASNSPGADQPSVGKPSVGFKPLTEMSADDRYKGEDGGLYGGGQNEIPETLRKFASEENSRIKPVDKDGRPDTDGKIALVSISMSNATQEFSRFKQLADADPQKSTNVAIVDCAQGGQTMARWANPKADCWVEADRRLERAEVSHPQVQIAWVKIANAGPSGDLAEHGKQLQRDTQSVLVNLKDRFPNLRIVYLGSRIYGGWGDGKLNPEPYAYEGAFVVRWLIKDQLENRDAATPLVLWGPYFWADGLTPRKDDGLVWMRSDLANDGTHPSDSGRQKVAEQLLAFFKTDEFTKVWFLKPLD